MKKLEEWRVKIERVNHEKGDNDELFQTEGDSISEVVQNYLVQNFRSYSENKGINNKSLQLE